MGLIPPDVEKIKVSDVTDYVEATTAQPMPSITLGWS